MKKLSLIASGLIVAGVLIGCGGGSGSSTTSKTKKITASDAYVTNDGLKYVTIECSGENDINLTKEGNFTVGDKGIITFINNDRIPCADPTIIIPEGSGVDTTGDGEADTKIRMALKTKGFGTVANPIGTALLEQNESLFNSSNYKFFDPVEAKEKLLKGEGNETLKKLVAISDAIAYLAKEMGGELNSTVVNRLNLTQVLENDETNVNIITDNLLIEFNSTIRTKIVEKVEKVMTTIEYIQTLKANGNINEKKVLSFLLSVSDAENNTTYNALYQAAENNNTTLLTQLKENFDDIVGGVEVENIVNVKSISLGEKEVEVKYDGTFKVSFDKDTNTSIYKNITLDATCLKEGNQTLTFDFNISKNGTDKYVNIRIPNVNVTCGGLGDEPNSTIYANTSIGITTNAQGVMVAIEASEDETYNAILLKDLNNTDLVINLDSLKSVLSETQQTKITNLENKVNSTYLKQDANYTITITVGETTLNGNMIIGNPADGSDTSGNSDNQDNNVINNNNTPDEGVDGE